MGNVVVVGFDGLDKELIEKFGLENIPQEEFGRIDNSKGIKCRKTSELFTSFITGKTWKEHGVTGLKKWPNKWIGAFEEKFGDKFLFSKFQGVRNAVYREAGVYKRLYDKEDFDVETVFDCVEDSRAIAVPGYNPSDFQDKVGVFEDELDAWRTREFPYRKRVLFQELENDIVSPRQFLMVHFLYPDFFQHFYGDKSIRFDEAKLRQMYNEIDELAGKIKEKAEKAGYDTVIFMSDHGLPEGESHNRNAFYSCNHGLFSDSEPSITSFLGLRSDYPKDSKVGILRKVPMDLKNSSPVHRCLYDV